MLHYASQFGKNGVSWVSEKVQETAVAGGVTDGISLESNLEIFIEVLKVLISWYSNSTSINMSSRNPQCTKIQDV